MDSAVMHESEKPVFFKRDLFFTKLVVDKIKVDIGGAILAYTVYYAGTSKLTLKEEKIEPNVTRIVPINIGITEHRY